MLKAAGLLAAVAGAVVLSGCGGSVDLPDQGECPAPAEAMVDDSTPGAYRVAVAGGLGEIMSIEDRFRAAWSGRRLRERDGFREDYAAYAHLAGCAADVLSALEPPTEAFDSLSQQLRGFADIYRETLDEGEGYVASRNRSGYERWVEDVDALNDRIAELMQELRSIREG